jgi:malate/lactate dehydrogenase
VKGVNNSRHHPERAKILAKFADDVAQDGEIALPILVGNCVEFYSDIPALKYIRMEPHQVIEMGDKLDEILVEMVCRLL